MQMRKQFTSVGIYVTLIHVFFLYYNLQEGNNVRKVV